MKFQAHLFYKDKARLLTEESSCWQEYAPLCLHFLFCTVYTRVEDAV